MPKPSRPPPAPSARDLMTECPVLIPRTMSVRSAAGLLDAAGVDAAPVVDFAGRCVGVFTAGDYLRWLAGEPGRGVVGRSVGACDEVRDHMTRRFAVATLDADSDELDYRMREATGPFVVVLDRQGRPRGVVRALTAHRTRPAPNREPGGTRGAHFPSRNRRPQAVFPGGRPGPRWPHYRLFRFRTPRPFR